MRLLDFATHLVHTPYTRTHVCTATYMPTQNGRIFSCFTSHLLIPFRLPPLLTASIIREARFQNIWQATCALFFAFNVYATFPHSWSHAHIPPLRNSFVPPTLPYVLSFASILLDFRESWENLKCVMTLFQVEVSFNTFQMPFFVVVTQREWKFV